MGPTALISLLSAAVCVFAAADPTPSDPNASFSQLAVNEIGPEWPKLQPALAVINATLLPNNTGLHDTRKTVLLIRNLLDVFAPTYPNSTHQHKHTHSKHATHAQTKHIDLWALLRKDLDDGYTLLGNFQDLAHSNVSFTKHDVEVRRDACLKWIERFLQNNGTYDYQAFVLESQTETAFWYEHRDESGFFWKHLDPPLNVTGMADIQALVQHQLMSVLSNTVSVLELDKIFAVEAHDTFHAYRKQLRAINDEAKVFEDSNPIFANNSNSTAALTLFSTLYDEFGDLNDEWTAWDFYNKKHEQNKTVDKAAIVTAHWTQLKAFLWDANIPKAVHDLQLSMTQRTPSPPPPATSFDYAKYMPAGATAFDYSKYTAGTVGSAAGFDWQKFMASAKSKT